MKNGGSNKQAKLETTVTLRRKKPKKPADAKGNTNIFCT